MSPHGAMISIKLLTVVNVTNMLAGVQNPSSYYMAVIFSTGDNNDRNDANQIPE
jgi:hypothetical protein